MKTLIFNGSPKKNGDTVALLTEFTKHLSGDIKTISCYSNIVPCNDCRFCWENAGCTIEDEMQEVYTYLKDCDNIVIASPIWFNSISGPILNLASRIQTLYTASVFRKQATELKPKKGVVIIVGAEPETAIIPTQTALTIMKFMNVDRKSVEKIYSLDTNNQPAGEDADALLRCREVAQILSNIRCEDVFDEHL